MERIQVGTNQIDPIQFIFNSFRAFGPTHEMWLEGKSYGQTDIELNLENYFKSNVITKHRSISSVFERCTHPYNLNMFLP